MRSLIFALAIALPQLAAAQDGNAGIAFVQAPEQSSGFAMGATPQEAFDRAVAICVEGGAYAEDCILTNWCQPAGWSVDLFVMHQEGIHWHEVVCGLTDEQIARSVAAAVCDKDQREYLAECELVQIYNPDGLEQIAY